MAGLIKKIFNVQTSSFFRMILKRTVVGACFSLLVSVGVLGFPHEAHAFVPLLLLGGGAVAAWLFGGEALNAVFAAFLQGIGGLILNGLSFILYAFVKIAAYFLYLAGSIFNFALVELVFEYAQNFGNSAAVLAGWNVIRDFGNIALLFGFIFIGIATILNLQNYTAKKTLVRLLLFAVLTNFSLFTASLVVDVSNVFSYVFYNQAAAAQCGNGGTADPTTCAQNYGLASSIIRATGVMGWNIDGSPQVQNAAEAANPEVGLRNLGAQMAMLIFITILMVVMLAAAIMLTIRAVVLTFLIIVSPVGFVGMVVPFLGSLAKEWWNKLISQSFFAPIYLLLLVISLKIMEGIVNAGGQVSLATALTANNNSLMGQLVMMITIIAFLIAALLMSKKIGAVGAEMAIGAAGKVTGFAVAAPAAVAGRGAARLTTFAANKVGLTTGRISKLPLVGGVLARNLNTLGSKSFDIRGISQLGAAAKLGGMDFGRSSKAAQGGYRGLTAASKERDEKVKKMRVEAVDTSKEKATIRSGYEKLLNMERELAETRRRAAEDAERLGLRGAAADAHVGRAIEDSIRARDEEVNKINKAKKQIKEKRQLEEQMYARDLVRQAKNLGYMFAHPEAKMELSDEIRDSWDVTLDEDDRRLIKLIKGIKGIAPEFRSEPDGSH
jgi:hypothetical protein